MRVAGLKHTILKDWSLITCEGLRGGGGCTHFEKAFEDFQTDPT